MKNSIHEIEIFSSFLNQKGLLFTKQRRLILQQVFRMHTHFEADEIVTALRKRKLRVSRATVYRTLNHLEKCQLINKIDLGHGHTHYEHILGHKHHEHLYCEKCDRIIEFTDSILEEQIIKISEQYQFYMTNHSIQIFGTCVDCLKMKKDTKNK